MLTNICVKGKKLFGVVIRENDGTRYSVYTDKVYPDNVEAYWMLAKRGSRYDIKKWLKIL